MKSVDNRNAHVLEKTLNFPHPFFFIDQMTNFHSHADDWSAKDLLINAIDKGSANGNQMLNYIDQVLNADDVYMGIDSQDDTTFVFSGVR